MLRMIERLGDYCLQMILWGLGESSEDLQKLTGLVNGFSSKWRLNAI